MRGLERARHQAQRSLKRRMGEKETLNPAIIAKVGNGAGTVVVPGRSGWIYVRLHGDDNQLTEAKLGIPLNAIELSDAWVRVRRANPRKASYYVVEEFVSSSGGDPTPPLQEHPLDPDAGPHTGTLDYDHVVNKEHASSHHGGGGDPLDVKDLADDEGRLLTGAQKTDLTDGGTTTLHQHAGGMTSAVEITLTNRTGGERTAGDVVVTDPNNDESFIGTTVVGYQGKVLVVAETIADLTGGLCWERGGPFDIKVTGAVDRNEGLRTSATIYRAQAAPSLTATGVFAVALSPNISGEGTVKAVFLDAIGGGGGGSGASPVSAIASAEAATTYDENTFADLITVELTTSNQGSIEVHATVRVRYTTTNWRMFNFRLRIGTTYSITFRESIEASANTTEYSIIHLHWLFTDVAAGEHTIGLQWNNNNTGGTMEATARAITAIGLAG